MPQKSSWCVTNWNTIYTAWKNGYFIYKFQLCKLKHWSVEILTGLLGCPAWHNVKYKQSENNGDKAKKSEECRSLCKRDTSPA